MQYFVKGISMADPAALQAAGIAHAFNGKIVTSEPPSGGPQSSGKGLYVSRNESAIGGLPGWHWQSISDSVLFGWREGYTPADFARPSQLPGNLVSLGDGQQWLIPTALEYYAAEPMPQVAPRLPRSWQRVGEQWQPGSVVKQYAALWQLATETAAKYFGNLGEDSEQSVGVTIGDIFNLTATALEANYFISATECGLLGLVADTPEILQGVMRAVFALEKLDALLKKTA